MRAMMTLFLALGFLTSVGLSQGPTVPEEMKKLQGFWKCQSVIFEGKEQLPATKDRSDLTLVIKDAEYRMYYLSDAAKDEHIRLFTADMKLDPGAKSFDLTIIDGREKGKKVHGIYELTKEQLRLCYGPAEKARPTKFEAAKDSGHFCETWKPEKK